MRLTDKVNSVLIPEKIIEKLSNKLMISRAAAKEYI